MRIVPYRRTLARVRQALVATVAVVGLYFAGRWLVLAFASDATKIRWQLERMTDGFNATRAGPCLDALAPTYVDTTSGADREAVHAALVHVFFTAKDPKTKKFTYQAEMPEGELKIVVMPGDAPTATVDALTRFFEVHGDACTLAWEIRWHGELAEGEGGWALVRTRHETTSGARLR